MKSLKIMIVDDSHIATKKMAKIVEDAGHCVAQICETGQCALDNYLKILPDIITMDINMPDIGGIEATKAIIKKDPTAIIIMVTSQGQEQMIIDSIEVGAKGYILKPVKAESLIKTIEKVYNEYALKR